MSKKSRKILFLICLFLFILTAPLVILYSQGYRFDFSPPDGGIKLTQTGGIFIKTEPKQAEIYINNEPVKRTDFFFGSALIENLLPKRYKIEVKKENYLTWEKNLEIREKEVTEVKNIILFPKSIMLNPLTPDQKDDTRVKNFWFSPDQKKMVSFEENKSSSLSSLPEGSSEPEGENPKPEKDETSWALKLYDLERNIKSHLISEADVYQQGADLVNLEFSEDSKEIYLDIEISEKLARTGTPLSGSEKQKKTFTLKLDKLPPQLTENKITPLPEDIIASKKHNQDNYHLDNSGYLLKNGLKISETPFPVKPEFEYAFEIFSDFIFLIATEPSDRSFEPVMPQLTDREQDLYLFSSELKYFQIFFEKISGLEVSPDKKKVAFFSNSEVWVFFLMDEGIKKVDDKLFISRLSERIGNVVWLNSDYLSFNSGSNLKVAELDDRDRIQIWDIASSPDLEAEIKIYFNENNKNLYIINRGSLFVSEKIF